jgi:hypothetical protein
VTSVPRCLHHELILQRRRMKQKTPQVMCKIRQVPARVAGSTRIKTLALSATCTLLHLQHTQICLLRHGPGDLQKHPSALQTDSQRAAHKGEETPAQASAEVNRKGGNAVGRGYMGALYMGALLSLGTSQRQGNRQVPKHQVPHPWTRNVLHLLRYHPHRCPLHPHPPRCPLRLRTLPPPRRRRPPRRGTRQPRSLMMANSFGIYIHIHAHGHRHDQDIDTIHSRSVGLACVVSSREGQNFLKHAFHLYVL